MTVIPALAALLVRPALPGGHWCRDGWNNPRLGSLYRSALTFAVQRPLATVFACLVLPVAGFVAAGNLGNQFFPAADRDQFEIQVWLAPDATVARTAETVLAMEEVVRDEIAVAGLEIVPGYGLEIAGDSEEQGEAVGLLLAYAPLLATLMLASLALSFRSFPVAGIVGLVAVLSVGLGMLSLWSGGSPLGFNPVIGSAGLVGVAINASIVVLAAIRANPNARAGDTDAIVRETLGATRHIVATTLTTVGGFLPLLLLSGGDFWPPLAIVVAGGVGLSIGLGLVFTPAVYKTIASGKPAMAGSAATGAAPDMPALPILQPTEEWPCEPVTEGTWSHGPTRHIICLGALLDFPDYSRDAAMA